MKIKSIYIGGWFQRTTLQLSELYDFLRDGVSQLGLDTNKLASLHANLKIDSIEYGVANEEFVTFTTAEHIKVKLFEDGLIIVSSNQVSEPTLFADVERLHGYYEQCLSPAVNYLFSTGAPVFKELSRVENIYPYFIVCDNATNADISELLAKTERQKYFEFEGKNYNVLRGDKYYFINNKKSTSGDIEHYIEEQIFIREFKGQLHRYLNLHRAIWGKIDVINKTPAATASELLQMSTQLARYEKTSLLIEGRLAQMSTYIDVREHGVKSDQELMDFLAISGYRYAALAGTLSYMQSLWQTTRRYAESTQALLARANQERTSHHLHSVVLLLGLIAIVSVVGLIFGTALKFSIDGIIYAAMVLIICLIAAQVWKSHHYAKQYNILQQEGKE